MHFNISINLKAIWFDHERESERYQNAVQQRMTTGALLQMCLLSFEMATQIDTDIETSTIHPPAKTLIEPETPTPLHPIGLERRRKQKVSHLVH